MSGDTKASPAKNPSDLFPPDDANYLKYYEFVVKELEKDSVKPEKYLNQLCTLSDMILSGSTDISEQQKNYFLETGLPKMARHLIAKRFKDENDMYQLTCEFFQKIVDLVIFSIPNDRLGPFEAMFHVVDDTRRFYSIREDVEFVEFVSRGNRQQVQEFVVAKTNVNSKFCLFFMNYFGTKGGFAMIMERIEKETGDRVPIPTLRGIVSLWSKMGPFLAKNVRKDYIPRFQESVFKMMLDLNDKELRPVKKDDVSEIVQRVSDILGDFSGVHERCEMFCLNFALKCFKSANLEKRMQGLSYIEESIHMTKARKAYGSMMWPSVSHYDSKSRFSMAKWMTVSSLMKWIKENEIVESLFDMKNEPHRELIKRAKGLLRFLGEEGEITPNTVDVIWNVLETDKTVADAVYEMLAAITGSLEEKIQAYIFAKIQALPFDSYTAGTITLISELNKIKDDTLQKLWSLILDESQAPKEIVDAALDHLLDRCSAYTTKSFLQSMLRLSLNGLKANNSALQCILIMFRVAANTKHFYDEKEMMRYASMMRKKDEPTRQDLVNELIEKHDLLDTLFKEFTAYLATTEGQFTKALVANSNSQSPVHYEDIVLVGRFPHIRNLKERLEFLQFVFEFSNAKLKEEQVDLIWTCLMNSSRTLEEQRLCLRWFYDLCIGVNAKGDSAIMMEGVLLHIFKKLEALCLSNPAQVTEIGFSCYCRYMCCVNVQAAYLKMEKDIISRSSNFLVKNIEMFGLTCLWHIALGTLDVLVAREAMEFLVKIYLNIDRTILDINTIQKSYVDKCMTELQECENSIREEPTYRAYFESKIDRLVSLLRMFLEECKKREDKKNEELKKKQEEEQRKREIQQKEQEEAQKQNEESAPAAKPQEAPKPKAAKEPPTISNHYSQEVSSLQDMFGITKIAAILAIKANSFNFDRAMEALFDEPIKDEFVRQAAEFEAPPAAAPQEKELDEAAVDSMGGGGPARKAEEQQPEKKDKEKEEEEDAEISPMMFLANNQRYFDQLFDLLNLENINKDKVWAILKQLPTNKRIFKTFKTLRGDNVINNSANKPNWDQLLSPKRMYKMLYCLQIIDTLMAPTEEATEEEIAEKQQWCRLFFYAYGFHHLFRMLASDTEFDKADKSSEIFKSCLAFLLKIVHYFIRGGLGEKSLESIPSTPFGMAPERPAPPPSEDGGEKPVKKRRRELAFSATTGKKLVDSVDFETFVKALIQTTWDTCKESPYVQVYADDVKIVEYAMSLLVASITSRPDLLEHFYSYHDDTHDGSVGKHIDDFIIGVVLRHRDAYIRQAAANGLFQLCAELRDIPLESLPKPKGSNHPPHVYMLELLLSNLPAEGSTSDTCEQFFEFLNHLIVEYCERSEDKEAAIKKFEPLMQSTLKQIKSRPVKEYSAYSTPDFVLIGLMSLLRTLVHLNPSMKRWMAAPDGAGMLDYLWLRCLFPPPPKLERVHGIRWREEMVCRTGKSRQMALKLLAELAAGCPDNLNELMRLVFAFHEKDVGVALEIAKPAEKNISGYVGLRNPGCICYMNSFLQQLYMTPTLRYGLLAAKVPPPKPAEGQSEPDLSEDLLYQIQRMFGFLLHSENQYYDPSNTFCKAYKDIGGGPINLMRQEDASEFVYNLFARLETILKGTEHEKLMNTFTGVESQIVRCAANPQHFSESEHPISLVTVDIRGRQHLAQALTGYVQGDKLDDWKCADCDKVVGAVKRICYKKLSNTLIIHLKRFDYSIDAMGDIKQFKITDFFEFPEELDMEPYTAEGIARLEAMEEEKKKREAAGADAEGLPDMPRIHPDSYYQYELVGVLIHSGTQEAGHYYSFIKDRMAAKTQWYEFNDTSVRTWDITKYLRDECFGGEKVAKSAYILIYQRKVPEPEEFPLPEEVQQLMGQGSASLEDSNGKGKEKVTEEPAKEEKSTTTTTTTSEEKKDDKKPDLRDEFKALTTEIVPDEIMKTVWDTNHDVARQRQMFEHEYMEFLRDVFSLTTFTEPVIEADEKAESFRLIRLATYFMDTLARAGSNEKDLYLAHMENLGNLYVNHLPACRWLLTSLIGEQKSKWLRYHLIDSDYFYVREAFAKLVVRVLRVVSYLEQDLITKEREERRAAFAQANHPMNPSVGQEPKYTIATGAVSTNFIDYLVSISESTRRAWRRFHQYWYVLREYTYFGYNERMFLIDRGMIGVLVDYYMGGFSPYKESIHRVSIGDSMRGETANLEYFMDILGNLVRSTETAGSVATGTRPADVWPDDGPLAPMLLKCSRLLFNREYFASMLKQAYSIDTNRTIICHFSWEDEERSFVYLDMLMKWVSSAEGHHRVLIPVLDSLLNMKDSLQQWRIAMVLNPRDNGLLHLMDKANSNPGFVVAAIDFLLSLFTTNPAAAYFLYKTKELWWPSLEAWLTKKRSFTGYEWKSVPNAEDKLPLYAQQITGMFHRIENPDKYEEKDRIAVEWNQEIEERDKAERKLVRFTFNK